MNREKADAILSELQKGSSLRKAAELSNITHVAFLQWVNADPDLAYQYARAKEVGADAEFEQLTDIADENPPTVDGKVDAGWISWQKLRVDTRKWTLARKQPKKYGDRVALAGDDNSPLTVQVVSFAGNNPTE